MSEEQFAQLMVRLTELEGILIAQTVFLGALMIVMVMNMAVSARSRS